MPEGWRGGEGSPDRLQCWGREGRGGGQQRDNVRQVSWVMVGCCGVWEACLKGHICRHVVDNDSCSQPLPDHSGIQNVILQKIKGRGVRDVVAVLAQRVLQKDKWCLGANSQGEVLGRGSGLGVDNERRGQ